MLQNFLVKTDTTPVGVEITSQNEGVPEKRNSRKQWNKETLFTKGTYTFRILSNTSQDTEKLSVPRRKTRTFRKPLDETALEVWIDTRTTHPERSKKRMYRGEKIITKRNPRLSSHPNFYKY